MHRPGFSSYGSVNRFAVAVFAGGLLIWSVSGHWTATAQTGLKYAYTTLYSFSGPDGANPQSSLIMDPAGNLYGTAPTGGTYGEGVLFEITPAGQETVLYSFTGGADGGQPMGPLSRDTEGNLYGTTYIGGGSSFCGYQTCGVVFRVSPAGVYTVLHSFSGPDGAHPSAALLRDSHGNLYGATSEGGPVPYTANGYSGCGVVFTLDPSGKETLLYSFTGQTDGCGPSGLAEDSSGKFYGTTVLGGSTNCYEGCGVIYEVTREGKFNVDYTFTGGTDGAQPQGGLVQGTSGQFYGTTGTGGTSGAGTIFAFDRKNGHKVLYSFGGLYVVPPDAGAPSGVPVPDNVGNLFGGAFSGGAYNYGAIFGFSITIGQETLLYNFTGGADGWGPNALIRDSAGNLYGTTENGGAAGDGVVFKLSPQ